MDRFVRTAFCLEHIYIQHCLEKQPLHKMLELGSIFRDLPTAENDIVTFHLHLFSCGPVIINISPVIPHSLSERCLPPRTQ